MDRILDILSLLFYHNSTSIFLALIGIVGPLSISDKRELADYLQSLADAEEAREKINRLGANDVER